MDRVEAPKSTSLFAGVRVAPGDPANAYLRVSSYRQHQVFETPEGSVSLPGHHVRFSVWAGDEARCVISISESEAQELLRFLQESLGAEAAPDHPAP